MRVLARAVYGVFGALAVVLGLVVLIDPAVALPADAYSALSAHLLREQGAEGIFIGLVTLRCFFKAEGRRPVHLALILFTGLFSIIHWYEYLESRRSLASPLVNTVPFVAFAATLPYARGPKEPESEGPRRA